MASRARERSGKAEPAKDRTLKATFTLDGETIDVAVDLDTLSFREDFEAKSRIAQLTVLTEDGRVVYSPEPSLRVLVYAWVVLLRSRPNVSFDDVLSIPKSSFAIGDLDVEDSSPEA